MQITSRTFDCNLHGEEGTAVYMMPAIEMINHDDSASAERNGARGGGRQGRLAGLGGWLGWAAGWVRAGEPRGGRGGDGPPVPLPASESYFTSEGSKALGKGLAPITLMRPPLARPGLPGSQRRRGR